MSTSAQLAPKPTSPMNMANDAALTCLHRRRAALLSITTCMRLSPHVAHISFARTAYARVAVNNFSLTATAVPVATPTRTEIATTHHQEDLIHPGRKQNGQVKTDGISIIRRTATVIRVAVPSRRSHPGRRPQNASPRPCDRTASDRRPRFSPHPTGQTAPAGAHTTDG